MLRPALKVLSVLLLVSLGCWVPLSPRFVPVINFSFWLSDQFAVPGSARPGSSSGSSLARFAVSGSVSVPHLIYSTAAAASRSQRRGGRWSGGWRAKFAPLHKYPHPVPALRTPDGRLRGTQATK